MRSPLHYPAGRRPVMVTAYLGGAVATIAGIEEPFYFPALLGSLIWLRLSIREERLLSFFFLKEVM